MVRGAFRYRRGHDRDADQRDPAELLHVRMPFAAPSVGGVRDRLSGSPVRKTGVRLRELPQSPPHAVCVVQPVLGRFLRSVHSLVFDGHVDRLENPLVTEYLTHEHDVLIIGAGGAGLRAAVEASAAGRRSR